MVSLVLTSFSLAHDFAILSEYPASLMAWAALLPSMMDLTNFLSLILRGLFFDFLVLDVATNLSFHIITTVSTRIVTVIIALPISRNYTGQIGDDRGKERVC
jgi:hypothetical protein